MNEGSCCKLASLSAKQKGAFRVGNIEIGAERIILMAGPCAIESKEQIRAVTQGFAGCGVSVFRGSAYKPRTSPYSFQGLGEAGLRLHQEMQKEHGLLIETEVVDARDVALVAEYVDILRVGARNMQNVSLLKEVGLCNKPVILKRGLSATIEEWLMSAEYIMAQGNSRVILCERGIRTFETATRNTLDISSIPVLKRLTHLPVIVDPSHAAGRSDIVPALAKAAIAVGADGLLIEVHNHPETAKCDGEQALLPEELVALAADLKKVAASVGEVLVNLEDFREQIDALDQEWVDLLRRRVSLVKQISLYKQQQQLPMVDRDRERAIIESVRKQAHNQGLDALHVEWLFRLTLEYMKHEMTVCSLKQENDLGERI